LKKIRRYLIRIFGGILALLLLAWLLIGGYAMLNRQSLIKKAGTELQKRIGGEAHIGDIDISFFKHFPNITLHLSKVSLHDSLWEQHHHDLLSVDNIFIRFSFFSLFSGHPRVDKIFLQQGSIYLFTDSTGYSNLNGILNRKQETTPKAAQKEILPPAISIANIRFVMDNQDNHKLLDFDIRQMDCLFEKNDRTLIIQVNTDLTVNNFILNEEKGSFLKKKSLSGQFNILYNTASHIVQAEKMAIQIGGHPFLISGRFFPDVSPDPFSFTIETSGILYRQATALLTPALEQKLNEYDIDKPISLHAVIDAGSADDHMPLLNIRLLLDKGTVSTPIGQFTETTFTGTFNNEWIHGHKREDENSIIRFFPFTAKWENIPLQSDTVTVTNLHRPVLACNLHSAVELSRLNELSGSTSIQFVKGSGKLDVSFRGPLSGDDSTISSINGTLDLDTASITYLPYQFRLNDCNGRLRFKDQDFFVDKLEARAGSSKILVKGTSKNLVSFLGNSPDKVTIDWSITSPHLDLGDFTTLAGQPSYSNSNPDTKTGKTPFGKTSARIDQLLKQCTVNLQLAAGDISYKKFTGARAKAELSFSNNEIRLNNMQVQQEIGSLTLNGKIRREAGKSGNPMSLQSHMEQVDISKIFNSFDNFGQQSITGKNLKGTLTADIQMTGRLTDKAQVLQNSLKGTVKFSLKNGQLVNFEPMEKINESVLKKRDLSDIYFAELTNQLDVDTSTITIHRMEIQSTALVLFVEGTYNWKRGTDLSIQVPLSNLKKRKQGEPPPKLGVNGKTGLSVHLRAKTGEDGKLKISWDPFKKALKKNR
jgi:AsmA-like protein